ncbi:MAG: hypothetical protein GY714_06095 [Desulfobacterales bacterium]|nr:hypothetical protein [Desulfobacterales bacterium]MCP4163864.1 hypothetical protein [Deltaproteobacteria bacterium]
MYIKINTNFVDTLVKFNDILSSYGETYDQWYVGLTRDPRHSFVDIHKVDFNNIHWILTNKCSPAITVYSKKTLIALGCKYNKELDMDRPDRVYLYKKCIK